MAHYDGHVEAARESYLATLKGALAEKNKEIERLKAALAERDLIIAKACKALHDSSRALLDELDRVRADFQKREQHLLVMYGYLWKYRMPM